MDSHNPLSPPVDISRPVFSRPTSSNIDSNIGSGGSSNGLGVGDAQGNNTPGIVLNNNLQYNLNNSNSSGGYVPLRPVMVQSPLVNNNTSNVNMQFPSPPPPPSTVGGMVQSDLNLASILACLQTEWRRYERERNEWEIERASMRARIALLEGERRSGENTKTDLLRRIKMLEYALRQERAKSSPNKEESSQDGTGTGQIKTSKASESATDFNGILLGASHDAQSEAAASINSRLSQADEASKESKIRQQGSGWRTAASARDAKARQKAREYLTQCLQEINFLSHPLTLNPLPNRPSFAVPPHVNGSAVSTTRPLKVPGPDNLSSSQSISNRFGPSDTQSKDASDVPSTQNADTALAQPVKILSNPLRRETSSDLIPDQQRDAPTNAPQMVGDSANSSNSRARTLIPFDVARDEDADDDDSETVAEPSDSEPSDFDPSADKPTGGLSGKTAAPPVPAQTQDISALGDSLKDHDDCSKIDSLPQATMTDLAVEPVPAGDAPLPIIPTHALTTEDVASERGPLAKQADEVAASASTPKDFEDSLLATAAKSSDDKSVPTT